MEKLYFIQHITLQKQTGTELHNLTLTRKDKLKVYFKYTASILYQYEVQSKYTWIVLHAMKYNCSTIWKVYFKYTAYEKIEFTLVK